jgi:DNA-binding LacI/PurR family transcriptional regulator
LDVLTLYRTDVKEAARPPARLKDVAVLAGVSVKTVSNVVNDYPHIRPATRRKVEEAIARLGYRPNLVARTLARGQSGVVALAVPELDAPYFAELAHHMVREAVSRGWTVLVDETGQIHDSSLLERERSAASGIRDHLIDGVILNPLALNDVDIARYGSVPLVLLGERLGSEQADHVAIDNRAAAAEATRHLIERGRVRIAAIGPQPLPYGHSARLRLQGYRDALDQAGRPYERALVVDSLDWRRQSGADCARQLLELRNPPDAVFCFNDLLALGAIHGLREEGLRIPDDVAVVGFDDIEESRYSLPSLTTISPDKAAIAKEALGRLAARLQGSGEWQPKELTISHTLEVRASSGS